MYADTQSPDALGVSDFTHHGVAYETEALPATATARRDLVAKIAAVDGCSEEQAADEVRSFERAFKAL